MNLKQPAHDWLQIFNQSIEISDNQGGICYKNIEQHPIAAANGVALHTPDLAYQFGLQHIEHRAVVHTGLTTEQVRQIYVGETTNWADVQ